MCHHQGIHRHYQNCDRPINFRSPSLHNLTCLEPKSVPMVSRGRVRPVKIGMEAIVLRAHHNLFLFHQKVQILSQQITEVKKYGTGKESWRQTACKHIESANIENGAETELIISAQLLLKPTICHDSEPVLTTCYSYKIQNVPKQCIHILRKEISTVLPVTW